MSPLLAVISLLILVTGTGLLLVVGTSLLGPKKPSKQKDLPYESGVYHIEPSKKDSKVSLRFYLVAVLFILFDIEILFLFPWAISYQDFLSEGQAWFAFITMSIFLFLFVIGLIWEMASGVLDWDQ